MTDLAELMRLADMANKDIRKSEEDRTMEYTKGEWQLRQIDDGNEIKHYAYEDGFITVEPCNMMGRPIATIPLHHHSLAEIQTNAQLISAAPDNTECNAETLRIFRDLRDNYPDLWNHLVKGYPSIVNQWDRIKQALAKAEVK